MTPTRSGMEGASGDAVSLARALSKLGVCSRSEAVERVRAGRVRVNGRVERNASVRVDPRRDRLELDGRRVAAARRVYVMLHKPRGVVTTASDERGRETVYACLEGAGLPWLAPVGRLDRDSEGLLLLTNDTRWAARVADPASGVAKVYHVRLDRAPDAALLARMRAGVESRGETLRVKAARPLERDAGEPWIEVVLEEGRNRQIRRVLEALGVGVERLVRVAVGPLRLGELAVGEWRELTDRERTEIEAAMGTRRSR